MTPQLTIDEIAFKLGYEEASNFRSAFKIWEKVPPNTWRKENA